MSVVPFPSLIPFGLCVLYTVVCTHVLELRPAPSSVCSCGSTQKNIASAVTLLTQPRSRVGRGAFDGEVESAEHAPSLTRKRLAERPALASQRALGANFERRPAELARSNGLCAVAVRVRLRSRSEELDVVGR